MRNTSPPFRDLRCITERGSSTSRSPMMYLRGSSSSSSSLSSFSPVVRFSLARSSSLRKYSAKGRSGCCCCCSDSSAICSLCVVSIFSCGVTNQRFFCFLLVARRVHGPLFLFLFPLLPVNGGGRKQTVTRLTEQRHTRARPVRPRSTAAQHGATDCTPSLCPRPRCPGRHHAHRNARCCQTAQGLRWRCSLFSRAAGSPPPPNIFSQ